jgi:hypothetical protein
MKKTITRWAALGAATVVGAAVLAPLGGVAHAAGTSVYYYVASKGGAAPALYNRVTGARISAAGATVRDVRASRDGSRLVDEEAALDGNGNQVQSIRVYDVSGHVLSIVTSVPSAQGCPTACVDLRWPNISPDGTRVVWTRFVGAVGTLFSKNLATGTVTNLGDNLDQAVFASSSTLIVRDPNGTGYWMPATGGSPTPISSSFPTEAVGMTVSPDGTKIAWEHELGTVPATADIYVAPLTVSGSGVSLGTVGQWVKIATGKDNYAPAFTRDNLKVLFIHADNETVGYGQVMAAPANGSSAPVVVDGTDLVKVVTQAVGELPPVTVLTQPSPIAAILGGTSATVRWTKPADADVSQILVRRFFGTTLQKYRFVALPGTSWTDTGLVPGRTYTYTFSSIDRAGRESTAAKPTRSLNATGALPSYADPTSNATAKLPFAVRFGSGASTVKWTVDYRQNSGSWKPWLTNATGSSSRGFNGAAGQTYQFRVKGVDAFGNVTPTVAGVRTVVPLNQTSAAISGGTTVSSTSAWLGSYRRLTGTSSYARITLTGNRLQVIAWRCSGCGSFALYENGVRIATVSTYSSSTRVRSVVYTKYWSTNVVRTFTLKPLGTTGHPAVLLDGYAMRR